MSPLVKNPSFGDTSCFCLFYFIFAFYRLLQNCLQNFLSPILSFSFKSTLVKVISEFQMFNSVVNFQFLFNLLAAFIRVVHFLLPEKNFSFGLQNASLSCFSSTYSSPAYNVTFVSGFIQISYFLFKYLFIQLCDMQDLSSQPRDGTCAES